MNTRKSMMKNKEKLGWSHWRYRKGSISPSISASSHNFIISLNTLKVFKVLQYFQSNKNTLGYDLLV